MLVVGCWSLVVGRWSLVAGGGGCCCNDDDLSFSCLEQRENDSDEVLVHGFPYWNVPPYLSELCALNLVGIPNPTDRTNSHSILFQLTFSIQ